MEESRALGWMPVAAGSLPFALVHGESLVAAAAWALGEAGVDLYDASVPFSAVRESGRLLVVHDPLCPLAPPGFLAEAAALSASTGRVVVGFRPVTDTVKRISGEASPETYAETLDRSALRSIATPVVIPADVLAGLSALPPDAPALVDRLAGEPIHWLEAPPLARRVVDLDDLAVLEAASRAARRAG